jgi:cell division transport system permease protein
MKLAFNALKNRPFLGLVVIVCIALCFLVFDGLLLTTLNLKAVERELKGEVQIEVYLKEDMTALQLHLLLQSIRNLPEVERVGYRSKGQAMAELESLFGKGLLQGMDSNPLPASLLLSLRDGYKGYEQVAGVASQLRKKEGVEDIEFGAAWLRELDRAVGTFSVTVLVFGLLIAVALTVVVSSFMRVVVDSQAETIRVMGLMGASRYHIGFPLLMQGLFLGAAGAWAAVVCLWVACWFFPGGILSTKFLPPGMVLGLLGWGMLLGLGGTYLAVSRRLRFQTR